MSEKEWGARESRTKIAEHLKRLHAHRAALKEKMRSSVENRELYTQAFQETERNIEIQERRLKSYTSQLRDTALEMDRTRGPVESLKHSLTEHKLRSTAIEIDLNKASSALTTAEKKFSANKQLVTELGSSEAKLAQEIVRAAEIIERHKKEIAASEKQRRQFSARVTTLEGEQQKLATLLRQMEGERSGLETKLAQVKSALDQNSASPSSIFVSLNTHKGARKIALSPFQMAVISNDGESKIITLSDQNMNWVWNLRQELEKLALK
ncbi:MAG: hypothetical protein HY391_03600 [Deltaproteobacteria bacterium]|nr:hypothetical protein [Deltaproteobacteria bacterium]